MDYRKTTAPTNTVTRDMIKLCHDNQDNVYETVMVIAKRANQISNEMKQDLEKKLEEFTNLSDNLEEVFENHSRSYEKMPKPTLIATQEYLEDKIYYKNPSREKSF